MNKLKIKQKTGVEHKPEPQSARNTLPAPFQNPDVPEAPDALAISCQLPTLAYLPAGIPAELRTQILEAPAHLYAALAPRDAVESILARLLVATSQAAMSSFGTATMTASPLVRELNMRGGAKLALAVTEITKAYDHHRGHGVRSVNVGQVKVEPGGQAIVGNVDHGPKAGLPRPLKPSGGALE